VKVVDMIKSDKKRW